jgi:hypothetical protein
MTAPREGRHYWAEKKAIPAIDLDAKEFVGW